MKDEIAKINCECCTGLPWESTNEHERKGAYAHADQILALFPSLEGIEHVGLCHEGCPFCNGTGTITRQAEWGDIDIEEMVTFLQGIDWEGKRGGRLRVKE